MAKDGISDEDSALFRQAVQSVKPLKKAKTIVSSPPRLPAALKKRVTEPLISPSRAPIIHLSSFYADEVQAQSLLSFCRHSIPRKRLDALKQGRIPREATLDLHGLRPEEAKLTLVKFIMHEADLNHRCLLIIHGKGNLRGEAPVLKNLVNHWLPQIPQILAFHSALPKDGGTGAIYVLLKRNLG